MQSADIKYNSAKEFSRTVVLFSNVSIKIFPSTRYRRLIDIDDKIYAINTQPYKIKVFSILLACPNIT